MEKGVGNYKFGVPVSSWGREEGAERGSGRSWEGRWKEAGGQEGRTLTRVFMHPPTHTTPPPHTHTRGPPDVKPANILLKSNMRDPRGFSAKVSACAAAVAAAAATAAAWALGTGCPLRGLHAPATPGLPRCVPHPK